MKELWTGFKRFLVEEEGATATEYAVMLGLIVAVAIITIATIGRQVNAGFDKVSTELTNANILDPG